MSRPSPWRRFVEHGSRVVLALVLGIGVGLVSLGVLDQVVDRFVEVRARATQATAPRTFTLLTINDVYRIAGLPASSTGGPARVRALRSVLEQEDDDLLVLLAGDFVGPSLMSTRFQGRPMVDMLNRLDGDAVRFDERLIVTFGNHEFDEDGAEGWAALQRDIVRSGFRWIGSDLTFRPLPAVPVRLPNLSRTHMVNLGGVWVGLFSLTFVDGELEYLDADSLDLTLEQRVERGRHYTRLLRDRGAEFVIGLTHLPFETDSAIVATLGPDGPDLVVGGHEHHRIRARVAGRYIVKADADAESAALVRVRLSPRNGPMVSVGYRDLTSRVVPDTAMTRIADAWELRLAEAMCPPEPLDCLTRELGSAAMRWEGGESTIRARESEFGNWLADRVRLHPEVSADAALLHAGALRLNQNLPSGTTVTRRHVEELAGLYDNEIVVLRLIPGQIRSVLQRSSACPGRGAWLHLSGLSYDRDPDTRRVGDIRVGGTPLSELPPGDTVTVAVIDYLAGGDDGYTLLATVPQDSTDVPLKRIVTEALASGPSRADRPRTGRIRQAELPGAAVDCSGT